MDIGEKLTALDLFRLAIRARDADTATEIIERFAAAGDRIAEELARDFIEAGLGH